jgi:hypothetical protein
MEGASKGLQSCIEAGFCSYDDESEMVWVHEMAFYQIADKLSANDKRSTGVQNEYDALPDNPFLGYFFEKYGAAFNMKSNRMGSPLQAPSEPLRSQEQEQAQEQEQEQAQPARADLPTAVQLSIAFNAAGIKTQPADPRLIALADQGVTVDTVTAACTEARAAKPNESIGLGYVVAILTRWSADASRVQAGRANAPRQAGTVNEKFNFSHLDRSGDQKAMAESMARHGITQPGPDEEIEI